MATGAGIDVGASLVKGAVVQVQEDGSCSLLEALAIPVNASAEQGTEMGAALLKHKPGPFGTLHAALCLSLPEAAFDRVRIQLAVDQPDISDSVIRNWIIEGKVPPPGGTDIKNDLWDFEISRLWRRPTDVERFGMKCAEGLFARVPAGASGTAYPDLKGLTPSTVEPASLALFNYVLQFAPQIRGADVMVLDIGHSRVEALLIADTELVRVLRVPLDDLVALVADRARLLADQAVQRLRNTDLMATDAVNGAVRDAVSRTLQQIKLALADQKPKPHRALICGGLSSLRGAVRLAHSSLDIPAEMLAIPETLRSQASFATPFAAFPCAIGAALRAAGAAPVTLLPRKPVFKQVAAARPAARSEAGGTAAEGGEAGAAGLSFLEMAKGAATALLEAGHSLLKLPARLGRTWLMIGFTCALALLPTGWLYLHQGAAIHRAERDIEILAPDASELERQAQLVYRYTEFTQKGTLALIPWGEVISEIAVLMPTDTYLTGLNANGGRLMLTGRVRGNLSLRLKRIVEQLKQSPALKRQGLIPPDL